MLSLLVTALLAASSTPSYPWLAGAPPSRTLESAFPAPKGFTRVEEANGSFGAFLRDLPLQADGASVLAYDGSVIRSGSDPRIAAVSALDVGTRDLQQCADSIIRLHAEWRWAQSTRESISYPLTSGARAAWRDWSHGERPHVKGQRVSWSSDAAADGSHASFRRYLDFVFAYAGTRSLSAYATPVPRAQLQPGDFFVLPSTRDAGHAVLVLDLARDAKGHDLALLGEGFMPAQSFHVLRDAKGSPWFALEGDAVATPFWVPFPWSSLRRLP